MAKRSDVYVAINTERAYQDKRGSPETTQCGGKHEVPTFLTFMREYLRRAELLASSIAGDGVAPPGHEFEGENSLDMIRKVTALGVACMEQNGAPKRRRMLSRKRG